MTEEMRQKEFEDKFNDLCKRKEAGYLIDDEGRFNKMFQKIWKEKKATLKDDK